QREHFTSALRNRLLVDSAQVFQQIKSLVHGPGRWWCYPRKFIHIPDTPLAQLKKKGGEIGVEDFRISISHQVDMGRLTPQSVTNARAEASCPAGALVCSVGGD